MCKNNCYNLKIIIRYLHMNEDISKLYSSSINEYDVFHTYTSLILHSPKMAIIDFETFIVVRQHFQK